MRAATAIVGAIAAASILIALAFILSGGGSGKSVVTRTVTEKAQAREEGPKEEAVAPEREASQYGGPQRCGSGELTVENVSCEVGEQIHEAYEEGGRGELLAEDQGTGETITMSCGGSAPVECRGPGGAKVYFGD